MPRILKIILIIIITIIVLTWIGILLFFHFSHFVKMMLLIVNYLIMGNIVLFLILDHVAQLQARVFKLVFFQKAEKYIIMIQEMSLL